MRQQDTVTRGSHIDSTSATTSSANVANAPHSMSNMRTTQEITEVNRGFASSVCKDEPMDLDIPTATDPNLIPMTLIYSTEDAAFNFNDEDSLTRSTRKRGPIPTVFIAPSDNTHTFSNTPLKTESIIPMSETTNEIPSPDCLGSPATPPRTLRRTKKLSNNSEAPPTSPPVSRTSCFSIRRRPSGLQRSPSPQPPPTQPLPPIPTIATPPETPKMKVPQRASILTPATPESLVEDPTPTPSSPKPELIPTSLPTTPDYSSLLITSHPRRKLPCITAARFAGSNARPASAVPNLTSPPTSSTSSAFPKAKAAQSPSPSESARTPQSSKLPVTPDAVMVHAASSPSSPPPRHVETVPPLPSLAELEKYYHNTVKPAQQKRYTSTLDANDYDEDMDLREVGLKKKASKMVKERRSGGFRDRSNTGKYQFPLSLSLSLGRKRGKTVAGFEKEKDVLPPLPSNRTSGPRISRSMAFTERDRDENGSGCSGYVIRPATRAPPVDEVTDEGRKKKLSKVKSTIGLMSTSSSSGQPSPVKPTFGIRLKEMFGRFNGSES